MFKRELKYHIVSTIAIFFLAGLVNVVVFCSNCLEEPYFLSFIFYVNFCYNGVAWVAYWKGSEFLVEILDYYYPWLKSPIRRFLISLASIAIYDEVEKLNYADAHVYSIILFALAFLVLLWVYSYGRNRLSSVMR